MRFGLNFFPAFRSSDLSAADYFAQTLRICERGDELGFDSVKTVEHYFHEYGGYSTNPSILLSAIAARTKRMRPITGAVIPAFNNPLKLAGELTMLDNISQGRLDVGFGRAFIPDEFEAFHVPMDESRARFEESIAVIKRLWTEDRVTFAGRFHQLRDVHSMPRPYQQPHPPIWIAAISSEESFTWPARQGYNLMIVPYAGGLERTSTFVKAYRQAWREAGYPPGEERVQMSFHCYIAETRYEAIESYKRPMTTYLEVFTEAVSGWKNTSSLSYPGYDKLVSSIASQTWKTNLDNRTAFVGTPDDVVEHIHYLRSLFGEMEPSMQVTFGNVSEAEAMRTIELFAQHVMPHFKTPVQETANAPIAD
ncbi:MAG TPA: LLM class flavin-dependent oxidoreductase [Ktedonobacteraceae bacterium]|nr:LLM class flavin-dependent oxidoreductase [Ktedonobacteraceae bacterium]